MARKRSKKVELELVVTKAKLEKEISELQLKANEAQAVASASHYRGLREFLKNSKAIVHDAARAAHGQAKIDYAALRVEDKKNQNFHKDAQRAETTRNKRLTNSLNRRNRQKDATIETNKKQEIANVAVAEAKHKAETAQKVRTDNARDNLITRVRRAAHNAAVNAQTLLQATNKTSTQIQVGQHNMASAASRAMAAVHNAAAAQLRVDDTKNRNAHNRWKRQQEVIDKNEASQFAAEKRNKWRAKQAKLEAAASQVLPFKHLGQLTRSFRQFGEIIGSAIRKGVYWSLFSGGFVAYGVKKLIETVSERQTQEFALGTMLYKQAKPGDPEWDNTDRGKWNKSMALSRYAQKQVQRKAIETPVEESDILDAASRLSSFWLPGQSTKSLIEISTNAAVLEKLSGMKQGTVSGDVRQLLRNRGKVQARDIQTSFLFNKADTIKDIFENKGLTEIEKVNRAKEVIQEALSLSQAMADDFAKSLPGVVSTMQDNLKGFVREISGPAIEFLSVQASRLTALLNNPEFKKKAESFLTNVIEKTTKAVEFLMEHGDSILEWMGRFFKLWVGGQAAGLVGAVSDMIAAFNKLKIATNMSALALGPLLGGLAALGMILVDLLPWYITDHMTENEYGLTKGEINLKSSLKNRRDAAVDRIQKERGLSRLEASRWANINDPETIELNKQYYDKNNKFRDYERYIQAKALENIRLKNLKAKADSVGQGYDAEHAYEQLHAYNKDQPNINVDARHSTINVNQQLNVDDPTRIAGHAIRDGFERLVRQPLSNSYGLGQVGMSP